MLNKLEQNWIVICIIVFVLVLVLNQFKSKFESKINKNNNKGEILFKQEQDLDGDGAKEEIQLNLLYKNRNGIIPSENAQLIILKKGNGKIKKFFFLQYNFGTISIVKLFNDNKKQLILTIGVGAHSSLTHIYKFENNILNSICPGIDERGDLEKEEKLDCLFFSDSELIYPKDLDGDNIFEIVNLGNTVNNEQKSPHKFYKWNGQRYALLNGNEYKKYLGIELGFDNQNKENFESMSLSKDEKISNPNNTMQKITTSIEIQNNLPRELIQDSEKIECIGPDGIHFILPVDECRAFNEAWGNTKITENIVSSELNPIETPSFIIGKGSSYTDSLGIVHFIGENGIYGSAYTDSLGITHYSDNTGKKIQINTNSIGITNYYDNEGNSISSNKNSLGITNFYGSNGLSGSMNTDSLGFTYYRDNFGNSKSCHTDTLGMTTCY